MGDATTTISDVVDVEGKTGGEVRESSYYVHNFLQLLLLTWPMAWAGPLPPTSLTLPGDGVARCVLASQEQLLIQSLSRSP